MALSPRAPTIKTTAAIMATQRGPVIPHYNIALDLGVLFQWVPGATDTEDDVTVLGYQGGTVGRWRRVRTPLLGDNLTDADATVDPQGNFIRQLPASTLSSNRIATMGTTNAVSGDVITIVRLDTEAFTYTINNGGPAAGTLATLPVSVESFADLYFNGTNWIKIRAAQML
jgi:hypothetical protein